MVLRVIAVPNLSAPPRWELQPEDVTATAGSNVTMTCSAKGSPEPSVTWQKLDSNNPMVPAKNRDGVGGSSVVAISNVGKHHQGRYSCLVSNGIGEDLSKTIHLRIKREDVTRASFAVFSPKLCHITHRSYIQSQVYSFGFPGSHKSSR